MFTMTKQEAKAIVDALVAKETRTQEEQEQLKIALKVLSNTWR